MESFGKDSIEQYAKTKGMSPGDAVRTAALYYLADREHERRSWLVPRFVRDGAADRPEQLQVDVDEATRAAVEQEALRQGVSPALLAEHAVLYFLEALDRGQRRQ